MNSGNRGNEIHQTVLDSVKWKEIIQTLSKGGQYCLTAPLCRMRCHWLASLRNLLLWFILSLWVLKYHWMTSDFSVSPELVCSKPWAPGGVNTSDCCPALLTAVLCKATSTHARGVAYSLGKAGRGILCRRERHFSTWDCPREKSFSPLIPAPVPDHSHARKLWPFGFWERLPPCGLFFGSPLGFLHPTLVLKEQGHCSKFYDYTCSHFLQIL